MLQAPGRVDALPLRRLSKSPGADSSHVVDDEEDRWTEKVEAIHRDGRFSAGQADHAINGSAAGRRSQGGDRGTAEKRGTDEGIQRDDSSLAVFWRDGQGDMC